MTSSGADGIGAEYFADESDDLLNLIHPASVGHRFGQRDPLPIDEAVVDSYAQLVARVTAVGRQPAPASWSY